jgi:uncharacterized protein YbaA (DUF1428 family)
MHISLKEIVLDGGTQSREKIDEALVAQYADDMLNGAQFPPVTVYFDGDKYYPSDGHHRCLAAIKANIPNISCEVKEGTLRDAIFESFGANPHHGKSRTSGDKRKILRNIFTDIEWQDMSDRAIANHCTMSAGLVASVRKEVGATKIQTTYTRDGKKQVMKERNKAIKSEATEEEVFDDDEIEKEMQDAAVANLQKEYEELKDQLTIAQAASSDDIEKEKASSVIKDLRAQIRLLEIELKEMTISRDTYQRENGELKKQVTSLLKKVKKLEG